MLKALHSYVSAIAGTHINKLDDIFIRELLDICGNKA